MTQKPIVFIDNFPHKFLGGGELYLFALANVLSELGFSLAFVGQKQSAFLDEAYNYSDHVLALDFSKNKPFEVKKSMQAFFKETFGDTPLIIQGAGFYSNLLGALAKDTNAHTLIHTQQIEVEALKKSSSLRAKLDSFSRSLVRKMQNPKVDAYLCVSKLIASQLEAVGVDKEKITVIHPGLPFDQYEARQNLLEKLPLIARFDAYPVIGYLGRLESVKGLSVLLDAYREFFQTHPKSLLAIAGEGSLKDELIAQAEAFGEDIASRILFLGYQDAQEFLSSIDIFVMPSLSEGLNISVLQAFALKVPVIAS
ncbi:MAG: glycosyltransferase, partial [Coriobacteriia bacterium]|nr:glycosyltransferase [Coriobacteriia bacterium]